MGLLWGLRELYKKYIEQYQTHTSRLINVDIKDKTGHVLFITVSPSHTIFHPAGSPQIFFS